MASYSKRVKIQANVLLEYTFDTTNYKSEDYKVLTNLKEKSKSFLSTTTINNVDNNLFMIDAVLNKYTKINIDNFNFLKLQNYFTPAVNYDKITLYFPSGFDFYTDYLGFYLNVYTHGYNNNTKYSISNFHYLKSNTNVIELFDLPVPFYYDEKYWVRSITFDLPSVSSISQQRIISGSINQPALDSLNANMTYGEGLSTNAPIFIDLSFITSTQTVFNIPYYFTGDEYSVSIPQTPEFTELGVNINESTQGDFFEIYGTYLGSNENMDEFAYNEQVKGNPIQLEYVVNLYEENILTTTQTYQVTENFTQKTLYRPVIQFSNTTALIDVELKVVSLIDGSYISKFGTLGITNSINKYGLRLTRLNLDNGVINPNIYNLKVRNTMSMTGFPDSVMDVMKVPYPILVDKYNILTKSSSSSDDTNNYISNGLLEILITPFDNIIQFNIAQDINTKNEPVPYNLAEISTNSTLMLVFKSDSEKLEREPYYEADNNYEIGKISYKIQEKDYNVIRRIYDKGYDNFYLVLNASNTNTQLYSGKFLFYEDVTFIKPTVTGTTTVTSGTTSSTSVNVITTTAADLPENKVSTNVTNNNQFIDTNMPVYVENPTIDKNYFNVITYVRQTTNIDKMDAYCTSNGYTPKIKYGNLYYFERMYVTKVADMELQDFVEKLFKLPLGAGMLPKLIPVVDNKTINVVVDDDIAIPLKPIKKPTVPATPKITYTNNNGGSGGSCFTPESIILMSDNTHKMMKDLNEGETIMSYHIVDLPKYSELERWSSLVFGGHISTSKIDRVLVHNVTHGYYNINNNLLNVTEEHMVFIKRKNEYKFTSVGNMKIGDYLYNYNDTFIEIISKEFVEYSGKVYNLTLDSNYVYYVNNILVHNKKASLETLE